MKIIISAFMGLGLMAMTSTASANIEGTVGSYGTAGCGLGSMLLGDKPGFMQVFAATTNGVFGSQTFGISSGTSNCADSADSVVSVQSFVETNRPVLAKDMSRGQGETIAALSKTCRLQEFDRGGLNPSTKLRKSFPNGNCV